MTNEQYLITSYFTAAGAGIVVGALTGAVLIKPLRHALGIFVAPIGRLLGGTFLTWLILAGLMGFLSVGYFGSCSHDTYASIVADYPWMAAKSHEQAQSICLYLSIALLTYSLALAVLIAVPWKNRNDSSGPGLPAG